MGSHFISLDAAWENLFRQSGELDSHFSALTSLAFRFGAIRNDGLWKPRSRSISTLPNQAIEFSHVLLERIANYYSRLRNFVTTPVAKLSLSRERRNIQSLVFQAASIFEGRMRKTSGTKGNRK